MLIVLLSFCHCILWNFRANEMFIKYYESLQKPLVILLYTEKKSNFKEITNNFLQFQERDEKSSKIIYSMVNCDETQWCSDNGLNKLPYLLIIRGPNKELWKGTNEMDQGKWDALIEEYADSTVYQIDSNEQLDPGIRSTIHMESYFHLVIQKSHTEILKEFKENAEKLAPYGNKFTYKYKTTTKPSLRVYRSYRCMYKIKGDISGFWWFMNSNKFGFSHLYTRNDLDNINKSIPLSLYVNDDGMSQIQFNSMINISTKYCRKMDFGFTSSPDVYSEFGTDDDIPFLVVNNYQKKCHYKWMKRMGDAYSRGLLDHALSNETCNKYREGIIIKKNPDKAMFSFLIILISSGLIFLFVELRRLLIYLKIE